MHRLSLSRPDGRSLLLYSRRPIIAPYGAAGTIERNYRPDSHLRWHPLRGEWVAYAAHRQERTFLPPPDLDPLSPTTAAAIAGDAARRTELPGGDYDVAVFENLFPAFAAAAGEPPRLPVPTRPGRGVCEVVVFTQDPAGRLAALPLDHLELLLEVWADRQRELGARDDVEYVFPFENRGVEVGVTLQHPHGQIYAYPFVPPLAARELERQREHLSRHGRGLLADLLAAELADGRRLIHAEADAAAFVPVCARFPYEVWVLPVRPVPSVAELEPAERGALARALKTVLLKYDALWSRPFPYILAFHQAPTNGRPHPEAHLHVEIYPVYRAPGRLKYLAGSEIGGGVFTADTLPEDKAAELRAVKVELD